MKIYEEIVQRFRNGEPLEEVRKDYRSSSQFAMALRIYLEELTEETERRRGAREQEGAKLREIMVERKQAVVKKRELEGDVSALRQEKAGLASEAHSLRKNVDDLKAEVEGLERRGFTEKVIATLKKAWVENGAEAILVLQDQQKALEARSAVQRLKNEEEAMKSRIKSLERKERNTAKQLVSEENRLDQVRSETAVLQRAVNVVEAALKRNYTPEDLISVFVWLERIEIQKQPQLSIERLVDLFAEAKSLSNLKHERAAVEKKVEELRGIEGRLKADVELLKVMAIGSLEEQVEKGKEAIGSVAREFREEVFRIVSEMADKARVANEVVASSMREKGKLEEQIKSLETVLVLFGISPRSDMLETVSPYAVILLLENVRSWFEKRFPDAKANAFYESLAGEFVSNPSAVNFMNTEAFLKFFIECVRGLTAEKSMDGQLR